jgi:hypothetical protein
MPTNTFVADAALDVSELNANLEQARSRYAGIANYGVGVGNRPHSYQIHAARISPNLANEVLIWRHNGLGSLDVSSTGAFLIIKNSSSISAGSPVITLTCDTDPAALGPDPVVWDFTPGGSSDEFVLGTTSRTITATPNKLIPGFQYRLSLTNTGSPGSPDYCEFGLAVQGYPLRGGGL